MQQSPFVRDILSSVLPIAPSMVDAPALSLLRSSVDAEDVTVSVESLGAEETKEDSGAAAGFYSPEEIHQRRSALLSSSSSVAKFVKELLVCAKQPRVMTMTGG
jgi:hypothetical protein